MKSAAQPSSRRIRNRVRDYVLYVAIAFAFLAAVFAVESKWGHEAFIRWGGLIGFTSVLFGGFISESGQFLRRWQFWAVTALLLAVHLTAFAIVLTQVGEWKLMWFMVMVFEYPVLIFLRDRFSHDT
jgi:hypothetical protein